MRKVRSDDRQRRRFRVMVGSAVSFTLDVSAGGFCTESMRVLMPGTPVEGAIEGNGKKVSFAGRIAWNVPGDSSLNVRGKSLLKSPSFSPPAPHPGVSPSPRVRREGAPPPGAPRFSRSSLALTAPPPQTRSRIR